MKCYMMRAWKCNRRIINKKVYFFYFEWYLRSMWRTMVFFGGGHCLLPSRIIVQSDRTKLDGISKWSLPIGGVMKRSLVWKLSSLVTRRFNSASHKFVLGAKDLSFWLLEKVAATAEGANEVAMLSYRSEGTWICGNSDNLFWEIN